MMRKAMGCLVVLVMVAGIMTVIFFQEPAAAVTRATRKTHAAPPPTVSQTFDGIVCSTANGHPASGIRETITVIDSAGKRKDFVITTQTKVYDKNQSDPLTAKVNKDDHVIIKFKTVANGVQEALVVNYAE